MWLAENIGHYKMFPQNLAIARTLFDFQSFKAVLAHSPLLKPHPLPLIPHPRETASRLFRFSTLFLPLFPQGGKFRGRKSLSPHLIKAGNMCSPTYLEKYT